MHRVKKGALVGLFFGIVYCCLALLIYALQGDRSFHSNDTTLGRVLVLYLTSSTLCGAIVGMLKPLAQCSWWGKYVVGMVAAIPISFGVGILLSQGEFPWKNSLWFAVIVSTIIFGIGGAKIF